MKNRPQTASVVLNSETVSHFDNLPNANFDQKSSTLKTTQTGYLSSEVRLANPGVDAFFFEANRPLFASSRNNEAIAFLAKRVIEGIPTEDALRLLFAGDSDNFREAFSGILDGETGILIRTLFSVQDEYLSKIDDSLLYHPSDRENRLSFNKLAFSKALMLLTTLSSFHIDDDGREILVSVAKLPQEKLQKQIEALNSVLESAAFKKIILSKIKSIESVVSAYATEIKLGNASASVTQKLRVELEAITKSLQFTDAAYEDIAAVITDSDKTLKLEICNLIAYQVLLMIHDSTLIKGDELDSSKITELYLKSLMGVLPNDKNGWDPTTGVVIGDMISNLKTKIKSLATEELAKGFVGVHKAIRRANDERESLVNFLHDRTKLLSSSYEGIEALAKSFSHTVIMISQAESVEHARAYLETFKKTTQFRESGASQMMNASKISRGIDNDSLKKILATMTDGAMVKAYNSFLPDSIKGLDAASQADLPSIPGVPTRRLKFDASQVATITVSTPSRLEKINDLDVTNMSSVFSKRGSLSEVTPLMFFILRMNSMIGNPEVDKSILGDRNTSFLMDGIQLPSIIKDSLLSDIRSISLSLHVQF